MATIDATADDFGFERPAAGRRSLLPDPSYLMMVFRRRLWLFIAAVLLVLTAVAVAVLSATPRYTAVASVLIEPRKNAVIDMEAVVSGLPADTNVVDTEVQIIGSPTVALAVVRGLHLDRDPEFVKGGGGNSATVPLGSRGAAMTAAERVAVTALGGHVMVRRAGLTYVIDVMASSVNADKAANIANSFAREYLALQTAKKMGTTQQAADWVQQRADALRKQAVADDTALQRYMIANNLMSAEGATMAEQQVSQLNQQIAQAQARVAEERGRLHAARGQIARGGGGADIGAALSSDTIRNLRQQEATASANLAQLQARYGDLHPDVIKAKNELADVRGQLSAELGRIQSTLEANVRIAESGLASLQSSQARARGSLVANSQAQVGLLELQRKAEASRTVYNAFLARAKETAAQTSLPQADASISSIARSPDYPDWPNYRLAALFGLGLAMLFGLIAIGTAEYLDDGLNTRNDVVDRLGERYAGAIPDLRATLPRGQAPEPPHLYILSHPFSVFAESMRNLGSFVTLRGEKRAQVIAITSPLPREGKTTASICLARALAMAGNRVVLVDADLRRHSVTNLIAPDIAEERLLRVLAGELSVTEALVKDGATDLMILPTRGPQSTGDNLSPDRVATLFAELRRAFDVVIVDTAPVLGVVETRVIAKFADATLLIGRWRKTSAKAAQAALDLLDQGEARIAGVALSLVDIRQYASTGLGDAYGYHKKFTGYYVN